MPQICYSGNNGQQAKFLNDLRGILSRYSEIQKELSFNELLEVECLLRFITKLNMAEDLTQDEKTQIETLSSRAEKVKKGLSEEQMKQLNHMVSLLNARWEMEHRRELTPGEVTNCYAQNGTK